MFWLRTTETTNAFWDLQLQIVAQLHLIHSTSVVVAIITPDLDGTASRKFARGLERAHWVVSHHVVRYADILGIQWKILASFLKLPTLPALRRWSLSN